MKRLEEVTLNEAYKKEITALADACTNYEACELKLELEYKLMANGDNKDELLYYKEDQLVGYAGICCFDGVTLEVSGMVHPNFRRKGIYTELMGRIYEIAKDRKIKNMLILCDRKSKSGLGYICSKRFRLEHSEYEMYYDMSYKLNPSTTLELKITTQKDTDEVNRQLKQLRRDEYFEIHQSEMADDANEDLALNIEREAESGMHIYLATVNSTVIGKTHLYSHKHKGGIYGLGIMPEYRRKGYGRQLLMASVKQLLEEGCTEIMLQVAVRNEHALKLYESCGFQVVSEMLYYQRQDC